MAVLKRKDIPALWRKLEAGRVPPVYLIHGERYLCREVCAELVARLLPDERQRAANLKTIDGEQEDVEDTLRQLRTYGLFPGRRVFRVQDSRLFYSKGVARTLWDKAGKAFAAKDLEAASRALSRMLALGDMTLGDWESQEIAGMARNRWQARFGFAKPEDLAWVGEVVASCPEERSSAPVKSGGADRYTSAFEAGMPADTILVLVAEAVDKRKRFYKYIEKHGIVVDLAVDQGGSAVARKDQEAILRELVRETLAGLGKKLDPQVLPLLLERVGFHPVAAVMETEKLALSVGEEPRITRAALDAMVGRTREEALFELTEAFAAGDLDRALVIMARIQEAGTHPLAIVAALRGHVRKLLLARAIEEEPEPRYTGGMSYPAFQKGYLAQLKSARNGALPEQLAGHPYAVYKLFQQAENFTVAGLKAALAELLAAEFRLKGSSVPGNIALEYFLFQALAAGRPAAASGP